MSRPHQVPVTVDENEAAADAAEWLSVLDPGSEDDRRVFVGWLKKSPKHIEEALRMIELEDALRSLPRKKATSIPQPKRYAVQRYLSWTKGKCAAGPEEMETCNKALMQIFLHRRIDLDSARELVQEMWLQLLEDGRLEQRSNSEALLPRLYRAACERAVAFRRGELSWIGNHIPSPGGLWQPEEPSEFERALGRQELARCSRALLLRIPALPDRSVLESLFLHPHPGVDFRESLNITETELTQVVWRAWTHFGEIVRERGVHLPDPEIERATEVQRAAMYVANALGSKEEERAFERQMMWLPRCTEAVDVWRGLKRGLIRVEHSREVEADVG